MRLGWLSDPASYRGGAELTQEEFIAAKPEDVEVVPCPPGGVAPDLDRYVAHNVVMYGLEDFTGVGEVTWYHHDLSPWIKPEVKAWLDERADHIFCSPLQRDRYGTDGPCIPPAMDLARYKPTRQIKRNRKGAVSIAQWRSPDKGADAIVEWAAENGPLDVYGEGEFPPIGPNIEYHGGLAPEGVANTLLSYATFVFLPRAIEPFCRCVAEAWASGCKVIANGNIGAAYWLTEAREGLDTAAADYWAELTR